MIQPHEQNRLRWNELTPVHARSAFYDVPGFLSGKLAIDDIERDGAGDIRGKSLLHLQCHFGLSSLSFARLGAQVTGVDFSEASVAQANELAKQAGLESRSRFICCDVLELDRHLNERFDVVFTSYGVITWLSNLSKWGEIVARFLKPDGRFFMAEIHPLAMVFGDETETFEVTYDYFHDPAGIEIPPSADYADPTYTSSHAERYWAWSLMDIFGALRAAGLTITDFREFPFSCFRQFPAMRKGEDGLWHLPETTPQLPLTFAITAIHNR